ncbi:hypothetical protein [Haloferula sp. BvORR071]|uniref:hypothetical protein n=1 Tax=Haloferula sp. BvORR071 TaxID=1396141 RepID=UPI0022410533|nr:hypothetical protein [Haloferula sp. BvORR071]
MKEPSPKLHGSVSIVDGPLQGEHGVAIDDALLNGDHVYLILVAGNELWMPAAWVVDAGAAPALNEPSPEVSDHSLDGESAV